MKPKAIFCLEDMWQFNRVYSGKNLKAIQELFDIEEKVYTKNDLLSDPSVSADMEYIFTTWSFETFDAGEIDKLFPKVKCVFYGAGTVQYFARPFIEKGIRIFSAWCANAVPVAEFTLAQILLANKGYFHNVLRVKENGFDDAARYRDNKIVGNYDVEVGIIGAGTIGKMVIKLLKPFKISVKVYDPFLSEENAKELGVIKTSLEDIFESCQTISNHLANNEQTKGMLNYRLFSLMKNDAVFINTGRGAQVVEDDLVRALREVPTRFALLDVTYPEPFLPESDIGNMNNIQHTSHIAGSLGKETLRLGEYVIEEAKKVLSGGQTEYEVTEEMLKFMA